jgi:hypothetical protein
VHAGLANAANGSTEATRQETLTVVEAQMPRLNQLTAVLRKLPELKMRSLKPAPVDVAELLLDVVSLTQEQPGAGRAVPGEGGTRCARQRYRVSLTRTVLPRHGDQMR